eukprot:SAG31_NODE_2894_length_4941_cov_45.155340_1_plen_260_part_00
MITNDPARPLAERGIDPMAAGSAIELLHLRKHEVSMTYAIHDGARTQVRSCDLPEAAAHEAEALLLEFQALQVEGEAALTAHTYGEAVGAFSKALEAAAKVDCALAGVRQAPQAQIDSFLGQAMDADYWKEATQSNLSLMDVLYFDMQNVEQLVSLVEEGAGPTRWYIDRTTTVSGGCALANPDEQMVLRINVAAFSAYCLQKQMIRWRLWTQEEMDDNYSRTRFIWSPHFHGPFGVVNEEKVFCNGSILNPNSFLNVV